VEDLFTGLCHQAAVDEQARIQQVTYIAVHQTVYVCLGWTTLALSSQNGEQCGVLLWSLNQSLHLLSTPSSVSLENNFRGVINNGDGNHRGCREYMRSFLDALSHESFLDAAVLLAAYSMN